MNNGAWWLALYLALGATLAILVYPPFLYGFGGINPTMQYGFVLSGPPAAVAAREMAGPDMRGSTIVSYAIYVPVLILELAFVWGIYGALIATVLKPSSSRK